MHARMRHWATEQTLFEDCYETGDSSSVQALVRTVSACATTPSLDAARKHKSPAPLRAVLSAVQEPRRRRRDDMPRARGESAPPKVDLGLYADLSMFNEAAARHKGHQEVHLNHHPAGHHAHHTHHSTFNIIGGSPGQLATLPEEEDEGASQASLRPPPRGQFFPQEATSPSSSQQAPSSPKHARAAQHQGESAPHTPQAPSRAGPPPAKSSSPSSASTAAGAPGGATRRSSSKDYRYPPELTDHYDIAFTIGEGAFAKVKIACHKLTGVRVAIKIIYKARLIRDNELFRAYDEVKVLQRLRHKNIVRLFQVVDTPDRMYLVMEYLPNGELFDYIVANDRIQNDKDAKWIFYQAVKAVQFCHANGIAHRDLKPENLLLGERLATKLCDFGLVGPSGKMVLQTSCGSENYTAPEVLSGRGYNGEMADIWSLGVVLFAMMCGFLPFDSDDTHELRSMIETGTYFEPRFLSLECRSLIRSLLQPIPENRPSIEQILAHPWLLECHSRDIASVSDLTITEMLQDPLGKSAALELASYYNVPFDTVSQLLRMQLYDHLQADFELLALAKMRKTNIQLPHNAGHLENLHRLPRVPPALPPAIKVSEDKPVARQSSRAEVSSLSSSSPSSRSDDSLSPPSPSTSRHQQQQQQQHPHQEHGQQHQHSQPQHPQPQLQLLASEAGAHTSAPGSPATSAPAVSPKTARRRRAVSSPLKADAAAALMRREDESTAGKASPSGPAMAASDSHHNSASHLSDYLKFMNPGSWRSLAHSIRQKVSSLREQRQPKALAQTSQVNISVDVPPEQVRDAVQQALGGIAGARTKARGYRFHTTFRNSPLFREDVKVLVEVCNVFGSERTETGVKISRVKGELASCIIASREIIKAIKEILATLPPQDTQVPGGSPKSSSRNLRPEEEGRRRANSDAPQKLPAHLRNQQVSLGFAGSAESLPQTRAGPAAADAPASGTGSRSPAPSSVTSAATTASSQSSSKHRIGRPVYEGMERSMSASSSSSGSEHEHASGSSARHVTFVV